MKFSGKFADSLIPDELQHVSLSFLVDDLQIRKGGVAANIAFGMAQLGHRPVLVGAVGEDFADYSSWLQRHGVDLDSIHVSETQHTARFVCTTDDVQAQLASFYPGAMSEAREIELQPVSDRLGGLDLVVVSPNDPAAMERHTEECRQRKIPFVADPSQQLAYMQGDQIKKLIDGAAYLFCNEYEASMIENKTGWTRAEILHKVGTWVTTYGKDGASVENREGVLTKVGVADVDEIVDPTGVGDAFRAGYLSAMAWDLNPEMCCQVGSQLASMVLETVGTQEYGFTPEFFKTALRRNFGDDVATAVSEHLG